MFQKISRSFALFLFFSFLLHLSFVTGVSFFDVTPPVKNQVVEIEYIEPAQLKSTLKESQKQIVEQQKHINDETPEDTKYLSQFNQTVKEETRAEKVGEFKNTAQSGVQKAGQPQAQQKQAQSERPKPKAKGDLPSLKNLMPQYSITPTAQNSESGEAGNPSQTDDHLDVKSGVQTLLSSREFVYYSYYMRIKQQIRQYWGPTVNEKVKMIYRQGRSIASNTDRMTEVIVILNSIGELEGVQIVGESGVKDLDDAAVEAFRAAAPFPNPPKGIVEKDGRIRIRWNFILEANSGRFDSKGNVARR